MLGKIRLHVNIEINHGEGDGLLLNAMTLEHMLCKTISIGP
jgi:hypothetical protein